MLLSHTSGGQVVRTVPSPLWHSLKGGHWEPVAPQKNKIKPFWTPLIKEIPAPQGLFQGINTRNCLREVSDEVLEQNVPVESQIGRTMWLRQEFQRTQISYKLQCITSNGCGRWHVWHWTTQKSLWPPRQDMASRSQCHTRQQGQLQRVKEQTPW